MMHQRELSIQGPATAAVRRLTFSAMYLAIALVLPFLTGQIPQIGNMLCPMHIPVLLCGMTIGWLYGLLVGILAPLLRSVLFGVPAMFPNALSMAFELAAYGLASGLLYARLPKKRWAIYCALVPAMAIGRVIWGVARFAMAGLTQTSFPMAAFLAGAVTNAVPGIFLQLLLIPPLVMALRRAGLVFNE